MQRLKWLGVTGVLTFWSGACSQPQMVVPAEISSGSDMVPATERSSFSGAMADETFKLGGFAITDVDRDWNSTESSQQFGFTESTTTGGYSYKVKGPQGEMGGGCLTDGGGKSKDLGDGVSFEKKFSKLGCTCRGDGDAVKVMIEASSAEKSAGQMTTSGGTYRVTAIYQVEGALSSGPSGYRIDKLDGDDSGPRGAVEVLRPGRAWFAKGMAEAERAELTCLYAGLMLYMPPSDH